MLNSLKLTIYYMQKFPTITKQKVVRTLPIFQCVYENYTVLREIFWRIIRKWKNFFGLHFTLTLSWRRSLSHRNQFIDTSMDWFLYDEDLRHERVKKNYDDYSDDKINSFLTSKLKIKSINFKNYQKNSKLPVNFQRYQFLVSLNGAENFKR